MIFIDPTPKSNQHHLANNGPCINCWSSVVVWGMGVRSPSEYPQGNFYCMDCGACYDHTEKFANPRIIEWLKGFSNPRPTKPITGYNVDQLSYFYHHLTAEDRRRWPLGTWIPPVPEEIEIDKELGIIPSYQNVKVSIPWPKRKEG